MGASIGNCVHVAGVSHFLDLAQEEGYQTVFLGPAVSIEKLFERIEILKPYMVSISFRLTAENVIPLMDDIEKRRKKLIYAPVWTFGGTKPVAAVARQYGFFSYISDGTDEVVDSIRFLRGIKSGKTVETYADNLTDRIKSTYPFPVLRHHFGLPSYEKTREGIRQIAKEKVLDVISLGPDQNAQQFFFSHEKMKKEMDGAGGVPLRSRKDFRKLKEASYVGNYPLMRCYSGTEDVFRYAEMLRTEINNAWAAIPLCWYNELDGRGTRSLEISMREAQKLIKWHAEHNIPVEINEAHHWAMRDAHDVISVAMSYISALNAKKLGVKEYISQYMFNVPNGTSFSMDLARVLAMMELVESLEDADFKIYRETRTGLPLLSADMDVAKGQLAASTFMQMQIKPHIIHVVGYCEADHAATPEEIIESCKIVRGVIRHTMESHLGLQDEIEILRRKEELISEAKYLLDFISSRYADFSEPLVNTEVLADCVKTGIIDAVHIVKGGKFKGNLCTKIVGGKCVAYDRKNEKVMSEKERLEKLLRGREGWQSIL